MKEYLVRDPETGKYWNTVDKDEFNIVCEIPEGADKYIQLSFKNNAFYKDNFKMAWNGKGWIHTEWSDENLKIWLKCKVLWQREEFFIDESEIVNEEMKSLNSEKHSHYFKDVSNLLEIDVYRVLKLFDVTDPCIQHAVKKLLCAGGRGVKDVDKDVHEAIDSLLRYEEMRKEDENE